MKKKMVMLMVAFLLFIPLTIVKADVTTDDVTNKIKEKFGIEANSSQTSYEFYEGATTTITVEKVQNNPNKIKISVSTDTGELLAIASLGENNPEDETKVTTYMEYEYNNNVLSYKGGFGSNIDQLIESEYSGQEYDLLRDAIQGIFNEFTYNMNHEINKAVSKAAYQLKYPNASDEAIINYLTNNIGIMNNGQIGLNAKEKTKGVEVIIENGMVNQYNLYLNELENPDPQNNNNQNNNSNNNANTNNNTNNQNNNTTTDNLAGYAYATPDNNFSISFIEEFGKEFTFIVQTFSEELEHYKDNTEELKKIKDVGETVKKELKDNGTFIELYNIIVAYNNEEKAEGKFTFRIKYTDEMKMYNTFELINLDDNLKKQDVVKMKLEGDYLVGELPHLSVYALVGKKTPNPGTGITKYVIPGVALLLGTIGVYALYKKKTEV